MHRAALALLLVAGFALADEMEDARKRWESSPYGPMLERILPPTFEARQLPEPGSEGARLAQRYCVQCHNLPNPAMHHAAKWPAIVDRMVVRMEGHGNLGRLMADMMAGVHSPTPEETQALKDYLQENAQTPLDPARYPELYRPSGEAFRVACSQCHVLPDPARHSAAEWPRVVARMQDNMQWMNRVVGSRPVPGEPQLSVDAILAFLQKHARR